MFGEESKEDHANRGDRKRGQEDMSAPVRYKLHLRCLQASKLGCPGAIGGKNNLEVRRAVRLEKRDFRVVE